MIAAYHHREYRPCQTADTIQRRIDQLAAAHAARTPVEAWAATEAALALWEARERAARVFSPSAPVTALRSSHAGSRDDRTRAVCRC